MNIKEYNTQLQTVLDSSRYATLIQSLGTQLNGYKDRFDKSDIIEQSIEIYTNGRLKWVDDIGRDHHDTETGYDLEFKYIADGLFTAKRKNPKKDVKVKLKNSLGKFKSTTIKDPADYYMIGQQDAIAIISWEEIKNFLVAVPDGIEAHIPFDELTFIFKPIDINVTKEVLVDYKQIKADAQRKLIESI